MTSHTIKSFPLQLRTQRLTEELVSAQKKLEEYEDLFAELYHNACERCKASFQRSAGTGASPTSKSSMTAEGDCTFKRQQASLSGSTTQGHGIISPHIPRRITPRSSIVHRDLTSPCVSAPESESLQDVALGCGVSTGQVLNFANILTSPQGKPKPSVNFHSRKVGGSTLQVRLERGWAYKGFVSSVKFSPDGKYLAVGVGEGSMHPQVTHIYDAKIGRKICLLADRYAGQQLTSTKYLSFSPGDARYLATGHPTGQTMVVFPFSLTILFLLIPVLWIWEVGMKRVRNSFGTRSGWMSNCVDFSSDGRFVVSSSFKFPQSGVRIWSMRDGSSTLLQDHEGEGFSTSAVKFSPDGKHVVSSDFRGLLRLWNVRTSKLVRKWKAHQDTACGMTFTPNGKGLVTYDHTLKYWDLSPAGVGQVEVLKFVGHTQHIRSAAISPDGRWLVSGSYDRTARIWAMVDASLQCVLLGHENGISSVDFRTDNYVACGSWDDKVSVWKYGSSGLHM